MRPSLLLLSVALPLAAALVPSSSVDAAATPPLVVEVDNCACISVLKIESYVGNTTPWVLSWTREAGADHGRCTAGDCTEKAPPRPCKGTFRVQVTWPQFPTPPCTSSALVSYQPEGQSYYEIQGELDIAQSFVAIDGVGGDPVLCSSEFLTPAGIRFEQDSSISYIRMECGAAGSSTHQRWVKLREACVNCFAEEN